MPTCWACLPCPRRARRSARSSTVENYGAGDVLEIERPDGKRFMVPMIEAAVPAWDDEKVIVAADFAD